MINIYSMVRGHAEIFERKSQENLNNSFIKSAKLSEKYGIRGTMEKSKESMQQGDRSTIKSILR